MLYTKMTAIKPGISLCMGGKMSYFRDTTFLQSTLDMVFTDWGLSSGGRNFVFKSTLYMIALVFNEGKLLIRGVFTEGNYCISKYVKQKCVMDMNNHR